MEEIDPSQVEKIEMHQFAMGVLTISVKDVGY